MQTIISQRQFEQLCECQPNYVEGKQWRSLHRHVNASGDIVITGGVYQLLTLFSYLDASVEIVDAFPVEDN